VLYYRTFTFSFSKKNIESKDLDVNEYERLSNITLWCKLKLTTEQCFYCCSTLHSRTMVFSNEIYSYSKMSVKRSTILQFSVILHLYIFFGLTSRYFHTNLKKASEWINCRRNKFLSLIIIKFHFFFSRIFGEIKKMFWHILIIPEYNFVVPIILLDQIHIYILLF
jgi:hypothetical protein